MKAVSTIPVQSEIDKILDLLNKKERPVPVPVEVETYVRPVEIRYFVQHLRRNRRYSYTNDFIY